MIETFYGGWLFHPAAVDYSDTLCSHGCTYCFASINKEDRNGNIKSAINTLYRDGKGLKYYFIKNGYPICVSNKTDLFAKVNSGNAKALFTHLSQKQNGIFIQTKGGENFQEKFNYLDGKKNVVVYLSITTLREDVASKQEPNAPSIAERLKIAEWLVKKGHLVIAAINPLSAEWFSNQDIFKYAEIMKGIGVNHIVVERLDMSPIRIKRLNIARVTRLGEALNAVRENREMPLMRDIVIYLHENGFKVSKSGMPFRSEYFNDITKILGKAMPNNQEFLNYAIDNNLKELYFSDYKKIIGQHLDLDVEHGTEEIRAYMLRDNTRIWGAHRYNQVNTFGKLLKIYWNEKRLSQSFQKNYLCEGTDKLDDDGNIIINFNGDKPKLKKG